MPVMKRKQLPDYVRRQPDPYWDAKDSRAARRWAAATVLLVLIIIAVGAHAFWRSM